MADRLAKAYETLESPCTRAEIPTLDAALDNTTKLLYSGSGGVIVVEMNGVEVTFNAVPAGVFMPIRVTQVNTGTNATGVVALN